MTKMCGLMNVGRKKGLAYAFSLCVLAMVWLCFISPSEAVSGGRDWFGRVIIWETLRAEYGGSKEEPDAKSSGECKDTLDAIAILQYCSGYFHVEQVTYSYLHKSSAKGSYRMKHCSRAPKASWNCKDLHITNNNTKEEPKVGDSLNVGSDGTYRLKVGGNIKGTYYVFSESIGNDKNCAGEEKIVRFVTKHYEGAKMGDVLPPEEVQMWEPALHAALGPAEPGTTIKEPLVGEVWKINFDADGRVSGPKGNVIQDNKKLPPSQGKGKEPCHIGCGGSVKKIDKNEFKPPKKMASWFFTTDPCEYVKRELEEATKIKETYENMLHDSKTAGMDGKAFNDYVKGTLVSDGLAPSAPMETNQFSCGPKEDPEETRKKRYRCLPSVVFEADLAHEKVHQKTCKDLNSSKGQGAYWEYLQDKGNYAFDDINAYNKKIDILKKWMANNCK
jgi:hypothetical protein